MQAKKNDRDWRFQYPRRDSYDDHGKLPVGLSTVSARSFQVLGWFQQSVLGDVGAQWLRAKISARSRAVDKVVHNLLIAAATGWRRFRISKLTFANSLRGKKPS
jgi:hypothetical protein